MSSEPLHDLKERTNVYQKKEDQSKDLRSTGQILIGFGIIGLVFLAASMAGVISIGFRGGMKYMQYGMMGLLFLVFLIMGIQSYRKSKTAGEEAESENELTNQLNEWFFEHYTADNIDHYVDLSASEEELYYERIDQMKSLLESEFDNLDSDYLDYLTEEFYQKLYEEE